MSDSGLGLWGIPIALLAGGLRVSVPFVMVSLGECLTERAGRINLGLEGTLLMGAMSGFGVAYLSGSAWLGVLAAGLSGAILGILHAWLCGRPRVNDVAVGISLMLLGWGLSFFLGKPLVHPSAPRLPTLPLGFWSSSAQIQNALQLDWLLVLSAGLAFFLRWALYQTRWGLVLRMVGESAESARAAGYSVQGTRLMATAVGGFLAGIGGSYLSLSYPGSWSEGLASGQGLMAVALVVFARWDPVQCFWVALLFGGAGALAPALQSCGLGSSYRYIFGATPYVLTLAILIWKSSPSRSFLGAPAELGAAR